MPENDPIGRLAHILGDRLYGDRHEGNVADALFAVAAAINKLANEIADAGNPPLFGERLDGVAQGLTEIAEAIRENGGEEKS